MVRLHLLFSSSNLIFQSKTLNCKLQTLRFCKINFAKPKQIITFASVIFMSALHHYGYNIKTERIYKLLRSAGYTIRR